MKMTDAGQLVVKETDVIQALYQDRSVDNIVVEDSAWIQKYNNLADLFDFPESKINYQIASKLSNSEFVEQCVGLDGWSMPQEYKQIDLHEYLFSRLPQKDKMTLEYKRMMEEYAEFEKRNMVPVLKFLIYFIDTLKQHKIVWGVGRGSSVASYILYLIGVHKINSIEYNLDIKEFLK